MVTGERHNGSLKNGTNYPMETQFSLDGKDKIKILIAEDEPTTRLIYDKGLFEEIFDKKMADSGKEAILIYQEWHPDIIILDIYLHEMTGYQVLKTIRTSLNDKKTAIVMVTVLSGREDVSSCLKLGIEGYIVKPFQRMEIALKILSYYARKAPAVARQATALCMDIVKQSKVSLLSDQN